MNDIEAIRLCAEAMGLTEGPGGYALLGVMKDHPYDPLHNDAQCFALVKRFRLDVDPDSAVWFVRSEDSEYVDADINRAVVYCVAERQKTHGK